MRKVWIYAMQIALPLVMVVVSATGCAVPSSTSAPASKYPAHIIGHVTIADKVIVELPNSHKKHEHTPLGKDKVLWVVDVSVKNNGYENPVMSVWDSLIPMPAGVAPNTIWSIVIDGWTGSPENREEFAPQPMKLPKGQSGKTTFLFFEVPNINPGDAQICYRGQEPYSYGKLSGGDKVAVYDWNLKAVVEATREPDQYEQYFVKKEVTGHKKVGKIGNIDITEPVYKDIYMKLETVGHWEKATSGDATPSFGLEGQPTGFYWLIGFNVSEAPWVVNWGYEARKFTPLDPVGSKATFVVSIFSKADFDTHFYKDRSWLMVCHVGEYRGVSDKGVHCKVVQKTGHYVIVLNTKDVKDIVRWWVKVGVE